MESIESIKLKQSTPSKNFEDNFFKEFEEFQQLNQSLSEFNAKTNQFFSDLIHFARTKKIINSGTVSDNDDDFYSGLSDLFKLCKLDFTFLLVFQDFMVIPLPTNIHKYSHTLMEDLNLFSSYPVLSKDMSHLTYCFSQQQPIVIYKQIELQIVYQMFHAFSSFINVFPQTTIEQLENPQSNERIRLVSYIIHELKTSYSVVDENRSKEFNQKTFLCSASDIMNPIADFLGFKCLMNISDYLLNSSGSVPCVSEEKRYNTKLFIIEKMDKSVPNIRKLFKDIKIQCEADIFDNLPSKISEMIPKEFRTPAFMNYICQVFVDPILTPDEASLNDSCGIPYICKTLDNETVIIDKLWLNRDDYINKFYGKTTTYSKKSIENTEMSQYQYSTEKEDDCWIEQLNHINFKVRK